MAEIAAGLLGPVIEVVKLVTKPITRQLNYLCCFTTNIKSLTDEGTKLDDAVKELKGKVDGATDNSQVIVEQVKTWIQDSETIQKEISEISNEADIVGSGCLKLGARFSLSRRAKKTTDRTKEHRGKKNFDSISQPGPPPATLTLPGGKTCEVESRTKLEEEIITILKAGDVNMIGIYGMGGLGKTTMAYKIRDRVLNDKVFQEVPMTVVSQQADKSNIQVDIGKQLGLKLKEETWLGKVQKLHARLSDTKKTLVIMDDVWEGLKLEDLGIPCDSEWCTILITSRDKDAMSAMGFKSQINLFRMEILSEEEAWCLFTEGAGACVDDTNLNSIAREVAQECKGLPIALKTLGLALKDKDAPIWNNALRELKQCDPDIPTYTKIVYTSLMLSYDFLDSEKAKSLFLLCCLFPEDCHIPLEELTYLCMGSDIFEGIRTLKGARDKMCHLIDILKNRSLLLDSNDGGHVRMHDVIRDVCIHLAKQKGCIVGDDCTWISSSQRVGERTELLTESRFPNLRLLSLEGKDFELSPQHEEFELSPPHEEFEFGSTFLEGIKDLYVLCIKWYWGLTSVPSTTPSLVNLKTLLLDSCRRLETISVVGKLRNLEILICRACELIEELPLEMKGLDRLKVLELTGCYQLQSIGRGIISSLVGLEELKMLGSFNGWEAEDRQERGNAALRELEALTKLRCLEIGIDDPAVAAENMHLSSELERFHIMIAHPCHFITQVDLHHKLMNLRLERESCLGDWIEMQLLRDTEGLYLYGNGANNVDLGKCQNIHSLVVEECKTMKSIIRTPLPLIEYLYLQSLPELEEICDGPISPNSFEKLKKLEVVKAGLKQFWKSSSLCQKNYVPLFSNLSSIEIRLCHRIRNLGQLSIAGKDCLPQLELLQVIKCEMMQQVFLWNDKEAGGNKNRIESQQNRHVITKVFPKLKEVELRYLPNLTTFYQGIQAIEFPLLTKLQIEECPKMKSIIIASNENINSGEITSSSAEKVSFGSSLEVLQINHNPFCGLEVFNGLEMLIITKCEGSRSLFTLSVAANLVSLRKLCISKCDEMIKVIEDEEQQQRILLFPKLEELELKILPKLVSFCDSKCEVELPLLRNVDIKWCPNMEKFSMGLAATPKLEAFRTDLTTYVGVGVDVSFDNVKTLVIKGNENPLYHHVRFNMTRVTLSVDNEQL